MHIIGTAGHVDHGKSSLVRALTGTDPDRWIEEQRRGMTLDLGFAHLTFGDGVEAGIIDVPGHERFLHNMLAGAAGMELVLLVIAANEGPKPQTLEHLTILEHLRARQTLVVLSKCDTVDAAGLAAMRAHIKATLRQTIAANAPIYPVSTRTGDGLEALRMGIHTALRALAPRAPSAPAYLPIDRVFARVGHGTVVTGTLMQGQIAIGDTLWLSPPERDVRVRGLQVFGRACDRVSGGTRVAINLPGVETSEIARGSVLAERSLRAAASVAVTFRPQADAIDAFKRRTPVRAYIGAAEILGTLVFDRVPQSAQAVEAHLQLRTPTIVIPGAPFVVRRVSPMNVLGGGTFAVSHDELAVADDVVQSEARTVLAALRAAGLAGLTTAQISAAANLEQGAVATCIAQLLADGSARVLHKPPGYIAADTADDLLGRATEVLVQRQRERPWLMGLTIMGLSQRLATSEPILVRILSMFAQAGALAYRGGYYATTDFVPQLTAEQRAFFEHAFAASAGQPAPLAFEQLRALMRTSNVAEISPAFDTLVASGTLVKVGEFVYRGSHLATIQAQLEDALRREGRLTVAEFRTLSGTSRKFAVPLLEFFDATGVTLRSGDLRVLRQTPARRSSP